MSGISTELAGSGLRILEAAVNPDADVNAFVQQFKPPFPVGMYDYAKARDFLQLDPNKRYFVPLIAFIDRKGMIRSVYTGGDKEFFSEDDPAQQAKNMRAVIEPLLAEGKKPTPARRTTHH